MNAVLAILIFLSLLVLAYQVSVLRQEYPASKAWKLLAAGFVVQAVASISLLFIRWLPFIGNITLQRGVRFVGLCCIIAGFHIFHSDQQALRKIRRPSLAERPAGQQSVAYWMAMFARIETKLDRILDLLKGKNNEHQ